MKHQKIKFEWELMDDQSTRRAKVVGGWVLETFQSGSGIGLIFIPDPLHTWQIEKE